MFAITTEKAEPVDVSVKCEPAIGEALRAQYASITPGQLRARRPARPGPRELSACRDATD